MTLLRPHIVAAASDPPRRESRVGPTDLRTRAQRPTCSWSLGGGRASSQDGDRPQGANHRERTPERTALDLRTKLMIPDLPAPASTRAGSERVRWFARGEG